MIRTAKEQFVTSPHRLAFEKIANDPAFESACAYALSALVEEQPIAIDPTRDFALANQVSGAKRLIEILKTIHEPPKEPTPLRHPSLNYNAKKG